MRFIRTDNRTDSEVSYGAFDLLSGQPGLRHAVSGRAGGRSRGELAGLNVSFAVGDDPAVVLENRRDLCAAVGIPPESVVCAAQVHGTRVAHVGRSDRGRGFESRESAIRDVDGLVTDETGVFLWLSFADCTPVLLFDPVRRAVGIAHAGWRGTVGGIAARAVEALAREFGSDPADLVAAVGPCIGSCCYEVGAEVAAAARAGLPSPDDALTESGPSSWRLDLTAANAQLLRSAGVAPRQIEVSGLCTSCRSDLLFSHRAQSGRAGRFAAIIGME